MATISGQASYKGRSSSELQWQRLPSEVSAMASSYSDKEALQEAMRKVQSEGPIEFQATKTDLKGTVERQQITAMAAAVMQEPAFFDTVKRAFFNSTDSPKAEA